MPDPLENLIRELRSERCSPSVQDAVARRLGGASGAPGRCALALWPRFAAGLAVAAVAGVLVGILFRPNIVQPNTVLEPTVATTAAITPESRDPKQVIAQAHAAFVVIGRILIDARAHAEQVVLQDALPPLADGFRIATTKLTHPL